MAFCSSGLPVVKNWNTRKQYCDFVASRYSRIGWHKHAKRLLNCGEFMHFISNRLKNKFKSINRGGCHDRLCPICQHVWAVKWAQQLRAVLDYIYSKKTPAGHHKYNILFITLTTPNAYPTYSSCQQCLNQLKTDIHNFLYNPALKGWGKDKHGKKCKGRFLGALLKHEVTINYKRRDCINLHAHMIAIVHGSYFHGKYYLKKHQFHNLWYKATGHKYNIDVRAPYYKDKNGHERRDNIDKFLYHVVNEISKYSVKAQDFISMLKHTPLKRIHLVNNVFSIFAHLFYSQKRLVSYGMMKKNISEYKKGNRVFDKYKHKDTTKYHYDCNAQFNYKHRKYQLAFKKMNYKMRLYCYNHGIDTDYNDDPISFISQNMKNTAKHLEAKRAYASHLNSAVSSEDIEMYRLFKCYRISNSVYQWLSFKPNTQHNQAEMDRMKIWNQIIAKKLNIQPLLV